MEWTKDKPTQEGYYWYCWELGGPTEIVKLWKYDDNSEVMFSGDMGGAEPGDYDGYWYGPLEPPPFAPVIE